MLPTHTIRNTNRTLASLTNPTQSVTMSLIGE
jgi:hypothetical protein